MLRFPFTNLKTHIANLGLIRCNSLSESRVVKHFTVIASKSMRK
uniref:Uncharacterized protein n=1 Tax=Arundo donax TaxID=35708 RepID=A0A0A9F6T9_ARUDO